MKCKKSTKECVDAGCRHAIDHEWHSDCLGKSCMMFSVQKGTMIHGVISDAICEAEAI